MTIENIIKLKISKKLVIKKCMDVMCDLMV